ncbi:MAG: arginine--tRNA ligase, partial [Actinomycetia bacterium]|nr:arginine--tRNA ligase [Actinomycetes bacterium]
EQSADIDSVEVAGPGFINMRLAHPALMRIVSEARQLDRAFGSSDLGDGKRVQVEFVSANPVGPLHIGHGRWAALGDSMARILEHTGHEVEREFYINDAGAQMEKFGKSLSVRYLQLHDKDVEMPQDAYHGTYVTDIARAIKDDIGDAWVEASDEARQGYLRERGYKEVLAHLKEFLHSTGVDFDHWFSERTLYEGTPNDIEVALDGLRSDGHLYEKDGALWFRSTDFGDDKDRVLVKADGTYTYFAPDIAYHKDKFDRGFDRVIDIWGADHHGYVTRMMAAVEALGHPGALDVVIGQLVNVLRDGVPVRMSKRTGEMITFEELVDEVGADATRYWFLRRDTDQPVDFDITKAIEQSAENPLYYVQYAYARICSIIRKALGDPAQIEVLEQSPSCAIPSHLSADTLVATLPLDIDLSSLTEPGEMALIRKIGEFGEVVELASRDLAPHKLTYYAEELAAAFHQFYTQCRVIDEDGTVDRGRLALADATRRTLRVTFDLLGIAAPERM